MHKTHAHKHHRYMYVRMSGKNLDFEIYFSKITMENYVFQVP